MARLILVRHGETDWNAEVRWQGQQDTPLNDTGRRQAKLTADFVRSEFAPKKVWSSDLRRCIETAEPLELPITTSKQLRELHYGSWEGRRFADFPPEEKQVAAKKLAWDLDFQAPGGEKLRNLVRRAERFIAESEILNDSNDIAIVGHGGSLRGLLVALLGLPDDALVRFHISNGSVSVLAADDGMVSLMAFNLTGHLRQARPLT